MPARIPPTVRPDGRVIDSRGRCIGRITGRQLEQMRRRARAGVLAGLGQFSPSESVGAALWEFFNPQQVQAEYRAVGKPEPTVSEIMTSAASSAAERAGEGVRQVAGGILTAGRFLVVGAAVLALLFVVSKLSK